MDTNQNRVLIHSKKHPIPVLFASSVQVDTSLKVLELTVAWLACLVPWGLSHLLRDFPLGGAAGMYTTARCSFSHALFLPLGRQEVKTNTSRNCSRGYYSSSFGQSTNETCSPCPAGTYQPTSGADSLAMCLPCIPGTFNELEAQGQFSSCLQCDSVSIPCIPLCAFN
jgi:hypothetical protein